MSLAERCHKSRKKVINVAFIPAPAHRTFDLCANESFIYFGWFYLEGGTITMFLTSIDGSRFGS